MKTDPPPPPPRRNRGQNIIISKLGEYLNNKDNQLWKPLKRKII